MTLEERQVPETLTQEVGALFQAHMRKWRVAWKVAMARRKLRKARAELAQTQAFLRGFEKKNR
jgi:hypothetical protein